MNLPAEIQTMSPRVLSAKTLGSACIGQVARLDLENGARAFLKWTAEGAVPVDFFAAEAANLRAIGATGVVRVPDVLGVAENWLLLEWLEPGRAVVQTWQRLGAQLARMHRVQHDRYGWDADNYIGSLPQSNRRSQGWPDFWLQERLLPQWHAARESGHIDAPVEPTFDRLVHRLDELLAPAADDGPSLLHGDLWNGNVHVLADGVAALIDPCCAYGHREVDLAMAELFGGFETSFFRAYQNEWPLLPGYRERRRSIYQLYYLLVHVNLFGHAYVPWTLRIVEEIGS